MELDSINTEEQVKALLDNKDLELELVSSTGDYSFTYSTTPIAKVIAEVEPEMLSRTYWLKDIKLGTEVTSPWDSYDHKKQISLCANLIKFGKYRLVGVYSGWIQTCPSCGGSKSDKIWRNVPKTCENKVSGKTCGYEFKSEHRKKSLISNVQMLLIFADFPNI